MLESVEAEKAHEYKILPCFAVIDCTKAFNLLEVLAVFQALKNQSMHSKYTKILEHIYSNSFSFIRLKQRRKSLSNCTKE